MKIFLVIAGRDGAIPGQGHMARGGISGYVVIMAVTRVSICRGKCVTNLKK